MRTFVGMLFAFWVFATIALFYKAIDSEDWCVLMVISGAFGALAAFIKMVNDDESKTKFH